MLLHILGGTDIFSQVSGAQCAAEALPRRQASSFMHVEVDDRWPSLHMYRSPDTLPGRRLLCLLPPSTLT